MADFMSDSFMGYSIFSGDVSTCADGIVATAKSELRDCRIMACLNPHSFVVARDDLVFRAALESADWLIPDGSGIVMAARWLGLPTIARVSGPDVFEAVMERLDQCKGSVFFLGASDATLSKIRVRIATDYPGVVLAGTYSPPFRPEFTVEDNAAMITAVNASRPDVLWVGMTAPKQEKWLATHRIYLEVGVAGAVGAAFDFFAGAVKRSPRVFQAIGLEWLPRFIQQPRRLWRRIFVSAPVFLAEVERHRRLRARTIKGND